MVNFFLKFLLKEKDLKEIFNLSPSHSVAGVPPRVSGFPLKTGFYEAKVRRPVRLKMEGMR